MPDFAEPSDVLIKIEDACRALQVSEATFRRFQGRPDWPGIVKIGRASRVRLSEVNRYIAGLNAPACARARGGKGPRSSGPEQIDSSATPDSGVFDRIRTAAGILGGAACPKPWMDTQLEHVVGRWRQHGLSVDEIETVARGVTSRMQNPPYDPRVLTEAMARFAARTARARHEANMLLETARDATAPTWRR